MQKFKNKTRACLNEQKRGGSSITVEVSSNDQAVLKVLMDNVGKELTVPELADKTGMAEREILDSLWKLFVGP